MRPCIRIYYSNVSYYSSYSNLTEAGNHRRM